MSKLTLIFPQEQHKKSWNNIINEFQQHNEKISPYTLKFDCENYDDFLKKTQQFFNDDSIPSQFVPCATYFLMDEKQEKILGAINIRYCLNEYLKNYGGHIGYGIAPSERRNGYATKMLAMSLEKCREFGIENILVVCNKDNIASAKTIINNGGILENEVSEADGTLVQRYWINI